MSFLAFKIKDEVINFGNILRIVLLYLFVGDKHIEDLKEIMEDNKFQEEVKGIDCHLKMGKWKRNGKGLKI